MAVTSISLGLAIETYNRSENGKKAGRSLFIQILINTLAFLVTFLVSWLLVFISGI